MIKKEIKLNIKNSQIAEAINLDKLKEKLASKGNESKEESKTGTNLPAKELPNKGKKPGEQPKEDEVKEEGPRRKARSHSVFAEQREDVSESLQESETLQVVEEPIIEISEPVAEEVNEPVVAEVPPPPELPAYEPAPIPAPPIPVAKPPEPFKPPSVFERLGPTGRHVKDLIPPPYKKKEEPVEARKPVTTPTAAKPRTSTVPAQPLQDKSKTGRFKEFRDVKPSTLKPANKFDGRDKQGLRASDDDSRWRKKRSSKQSQYQEDTTIRPKELAVRVPISIKDLASAMKLKSSQLIAKLFLQGLVVTINDILEDQTTIQLLGEEFGCKITLDHSEQERIRITDQTVREEIDATDPAKLTRRAPVVAFMGHVDHGKTSLIDYIRKANTASGEAGAITQHIGAFLCQTAVGDIAILDTPGHEAFSSMRARGADVTDIVVLVVAGDEGIRAQTLEAINHAKAAEVTIVVAINKCDKPNFNTETVYRQLADQNLLPETWGGQTITVNCSAVTGEGIKELLEMLALQAEVLELQANPDSRARGTVLESEMHKGMGAVTTVLVQNGTLKVGDPLVFGETFGRVKTMRDEFGRQFSEAPPSMPVEITGLSGLPEAGEEFIVVSSEREAREIAEARSIGKRQLYLQQTKKKSLENLLQQASDKTKKTLKVVLRADMQGSLEALKSALLKIESDKVDLEVISAGIGEISESDVLLAAASNAIIVGFHTQVESHADSLLKQHGVHIALHDIIYHAIDDVKALMTGLLDKVAQETDRGKAEVKAVFKSSHLGKIAGCQVTEGIIHRNHQMRVVRNGNVLWKGSINSLKRMQEDVREVSKGIECGILISNFDDIQVGDILESYEITYLAQTL